MRKLWGVAGLAERLKEVSTHHYLWGGVIPRNPYIKICNGV